MTKIHKKINKSNYKKIKKQIKIKKPFSNKNRCSR